MKKIHLLIVVTLLFSACNSGNKQKDFLIKENELLKRELEIERKEKNIQSESVNSNENELSNYVKELSKLMKNSILRIDTNGNIKYDSGTASSGRFSGNLKNVKLNLEYINEINNCDGCPAQGVKGVIHFNCKHNKNCLSDMNFKHKSSIMAFGNKKMADEVFSLLKEMKKKLG